MLPVGLTVPKLLPITGTWAPPFAAYLLLLSYRVMATRVKNNHYIGDRLPTPTTQATSLSVDSTPDRDPLEIASRCHANFIENVPLAFIFLTICELNGGNRKYLNYVMGLLFALRIAHADGGLRLKGRFGTCGVGRPMGYYGSCGVIGGLAGYAGWLVKGYWGI